MDKNKLAPEVSPLDEHVRQVEYQRETVASHTSNYGVEHPITLDAIEALKRLESDGQEGNM